MSILEELGDQFQPDPVLGGCVALFRNVEITGPMRLVSRLAAEYRAYAACDAEGLVLVDRLQAGDYSFLHPGQAAGCMVQFDSELALIPRPQFRFLNNAGSLDATLNFKTADFLEPKPVMSIIAEIDRFASLLGAMSYSVHHETNWHWHTGDFSEATVIYTDSDLSAAGWSAEPGAAVDPPI